MTIDAIFKRYEVPHDIQQAAFERARIVLALQHAWVGADVDWSTVVNALLFSKLGDKTESAHIRKKVGLNKYAGTLIARGVPEHLDTILESHDWQQILYIYCMWQGDTALQTQNAPQWKQIVASIEANTLDMLIHKVSDANIEQQLRSIEVYHYKNPSV